MSIAMDGRLRLLERRVAELERRLGPESRPQTAPTERTAAAESRPRKSVRKPAQNRKPR